MKYMVTTMPAVEMPAHMIAPAVDNLEHKAADGTCGVMPHADSHHELAPGEGGCCDFSPRQLDFFEKNPPQAPA